jgi:Leucine-rich repeat (LRR) protein
LNLNNNNIISIKGIETNKNLEILQLNYNKITDIENLDELNLTELHLFGNSIKVIRGLQRLPLLRLLDLSRNRIRR